MLKPERNRFSASITQVVAGIAIKLPIMIVVPMRCAAFCAALRAPAKVGETKSVASDASVRFLAN